MTGSTIAALAALERWTVTADDAVATYAPTDFNVAKLTPMALLLPNAIVERYCTKHYLIHSGRIWLAHFQAFPACIQCGALYFWSTATRCGVVITNSAPVGLLSAMVAKLQL
jgi:hypothetical protein